MPSPYTNLKTSQPCLRCGEVMAPGTLALWRNRPASSKGWVHASGPCRDNATNEATPAPVTPAAPPAPVGSLDSIIDERIEAKIKATPAGLDREAIEAIVKEAIVTYSPSITVEVKRPDGTIKVQADAHHMFARIARLVGAGVHVYLWGPAGTGKTTLAQQVATAVNVNGYTLDTMDDGTFRSAVLGFLTANGTFASTPFLDGYRAGAVTIVDEFDLAPPPVQSLLNTALANGHCPTPAGLIPRGEGHAFMGLGNSPMAPTIIYPERHKGSVSMMDRLYFVHVPQDEAIEARACGVLPEPRKADRQTTCTPAEWLGWVRAVRAFAPKGAPSIAPFTGQRAVLTGVTLLTLGETVEHVADGIVFKGADDALRAKVLTSCPLPGREVAP